MYLLNEVGEAKNPCLFDYQLTCLCSQGLFLGLGSFIPFPLPISQSDTIRAASKP